MQPALYKNTFPHSLQFEKKHLQQTMLIQFASATNDVDSIW
jgi:hypothetical protein